MPNVRGPRAGSLAFFPKKRAKRIYPGLRYLKATEKLRISGFAAYKAGMTQIVIVDNKKGSASNGEEIVVPATILDCPPLQVLGVRFYKQDTNGYHASDEIWGEKISKDKDLKRKIRVSKKYSQEKLKEVEKNLEEIKKIRLIVKTQPRTSGLGKKTPEIFEIEVTGKDNTEKFNYCKEIVGKELKVKDILKEGEMVDVIGITRGKGWQGPVKRFGVKVRGRKDHGKRRHVGTMGPETPRMIKWTVPQAGQMGFWRRTEYNKRILKIGENGQEITPKAGFTKYGVVNGDYMIIEGSVPTPRKRLVLLRPGIRALKASVIPTEVREILK